MKNIFKTFVAGAFIVATRVGAIIFGAVAIKGFTLIVNATGWDAVLYFFIGAACTTVAFFIVFSIGKENRYGGK